MKEYIVFQQEIIDNLYYCIQFYKDSNFEIGHRENDKPSYINSNGTFFYEMNAQTHRENDKPAIINAHGRKWWYEHGEFIKKV